MKKQKRVGGPLQCVPRKKMKEVYRHKRRWKSIKIKLTQISDDEYEKKETD